MYIIKGVRRLIPALLIFLFIIISPTNPNNVESLISAPDIFNDNIRILPTNENGFFILSSDGNNSSIIYFDSENKTISSPLVLDYKYQAATVYENHIYTVKATVNGDITKYSIESYIYTKTSFTLEKTFAIGNYNIIDNYNIAANENTLFFIDSNNRNKITAFNINAKSAQEIRYNSSIFTSIILNNTTNQLYSLTSENQCIAFDLNNNYSPTALQVAPDDHFKFLNDTLIATTTSKIFNVIKSKPEYKLIVATDGSVRDCCYYNNYILGQISDKLIYCYSDDDFSLSKKINFNNKILALSNTNNNAIALLKDESNISIKIISDDDFSEIATPTNPNEPEENNNFRISSSIYKIDFDTKTISNIPTGTTVAAFKSNINNPENYTISFTNYLNKPLTSGKLGTNATIYITKPTGELLSLKLIVLGDITGEGNPNSRDISALCNHLFNKNKLKGVYLAAADMNKDGKIDTLDLLLMNKSIE